MDAALDHVLGYSCINDVSARDLQYADRQFVRAADLRQQGILSRDALVLRAQMKTPGEAWLAFRGIESDGGATLVQTAAFRPRGILGRLYWWGLWPFHRPIFGAMARGVARRVAPRSRWGSS